MSFRGFVVFCLSFILFFSVIVTVFGLSSLSLVQSDTYTPYFEKYDVYSDVEQLIPSVNGSAIIEIKGNSSKAIVEFVTNQIFDYINGKTDYLNLTINLNTKEVRNAIKEKAKELPVCEQGIDPIKDKVACKPEGVEIDQFIDQAIADFAPEVQTQSVDLATILDPKGELSHVRNSVLAYKRIVYISTAVTLIIIGLILLIGWPGRTRGLRSIGIPITLGGISLFSLFHFGQKVLQGILATKLPNIGDFSLGAMFIDVLSGIYGKFAVNSIITIVIGAIIFTLSFFFVREDEEKKDKRD